MSPVTQVLLYFCYATIAAGAAMLSVSVGGASPAIAIAIAGTVLLACAQGHGQLVRQRERTILEAELRNLHKAHLIIGEELERTRLSMAEATEAVQVAAVAHNHRIVTEVRLLDTLVQQLTDGIQARTKDKLDKVLGRTPTGPRRAKPSIPMEEEFPPAAIFNQLSEAELLSILQGALEDGGVDVLVQPIVSLPQRKIRFYDAEARLRHADGRSIDPMRYRQIAHAIGLIGVVDNLLLYRCVQNARGLVSTDKEEKVFCRISPHSLSDDEFLPQFMDFLQHNAELADTFVFEIDAPTYGRCSALEKAHLRRLAELGYRFSLAKVTELNLNLADLRERQFKFVKIAPDTLLRALPQDDETLGQRLWGVDVDGNRPIAELISDVVVEDVAEDEQPADWSDVPALRREREGVLAEFGGVNFKELLNRYGIDLIAVDVRTEREVIEVIEVDADYGQGPLFGEAHSYELVVPRDALPSKSPDERPAAARATAHGR